MAEVLGTVASGIAVAQLAGAIVSSTQKIYTFWKEMKDAPKHIGRLLVEIELLGGVLVEYNTSNGKANGPHHHSAMLQKIYLHCETAIKDLDEVLETLDKGLKQSGSKAAKTWHAFRVVMKSSILEDLMERLERAKSMLNLASQCHMMTMQKAILTMNLSTTGSSIHHIPTTIATTNSQLQARSPTVADTNKVKRHMVTSVQSYGLITCQSSTIRLNEPGGQVVIDGSGNRTMPDDENEIEIHSRWLPKGWLFSTGVSLVRSRKYGQWKYSLRPIHIVSKNSPIFKEFYRKWFGLQVDLKEQTKNVINLIQNGKGSVFDTTSDGRTLLHAAAKSLNSELCRWLLAQGLQGNETEVKRNRYDSILSKWELINAKFRNALHIAAWNADRMEIAEPGSAYDTIRVLVELGQCDPTSTCKRYADDLDSNEPYTAFHLYQGSPDAFLYMLDQEVFPTSIEYPELAVEVFEWQIMYPYSRSTIAEMMRIRYNLSVTAIAEINNPVFIARILFNYLFSLSNAFMNGGEDKASSMTSLLRALLKAGTDIHPPNHDTETVLFRIIEDFFYVFKKDCIRVLPWILSVWLGLLRETGYDIQEYLCRESQLWPQIYTSRSFRYNSRSIQDIHIEKHVNSLDLTFSLQFWDLQDAVRLNWKPDPKHELPGAWIDLHAEEDEFFSWYGDFLQNLGRPQWEPDLEM
ncbi:hypothetical protein ACMFMF_006634 [Clarireedia jacksonii]